METEPFDKFKIKMSLNTGIEESLVLANNLEDVLDIPFTSNSCVTYP
jgi:hypothetical protein